MAVDIEELIIAPFREVVKYGKEAVANAEAVADNGDDISQRMAKAGKAVLREGERALKRLQPLWDDQVEKHGNAFKASMSKNEEIEDKRRKLEDLLYDFEDYLEVDTFDDEKFTQLQAAAKSYALHVLDIIKRLKLDGVPINPPSKTTSFPPLPPLPPGALLQSKAKPKPPSRPSTVGSSQSASEPTPTRSRDAPPQGTENAPSAPRPRSATSHGNGDSRRRLTPQGLTRRETTMSRASSHYSVDTLPPYPSEEAPMTPPVGDIIDTFPRAPQAVDIQQQRSAPGVRPQPAMRPAQRRSSTPDVLGSQVNPDRHQSEATPPTSPDSGSPDNPAFHINRTTAWVTDQVAVPTSPRLATTRSLPIREAVIPEGQVVANMTSFNTSRPLSPIESPKGVSRASSLVSAPPPISLPPAAAEIDSGLMASEDRKTMLSEGADSTTPPPSSVLSRETDCSIGPKSSLYQMKGFCEGAQSFKQRGHLQAVKKVLGYVAGSTTQTAKCISCGYAHSYEELSLDVGWSPNANFTTCNVRFRVRFLYKSHLVTERLPEAYYGCLFCAQSGSVVREGDPTVFANADSLFRHLSRHPQPLPEVSGITVLYGKEFPEGDQRLNDYDVHFLEPPSAADTGVLATAAAADMLAHLPVATATKTHLQRWGERKLPRPDGVSENGLLQFFVGARIIGVEYPAKWGGRWATGWHDGEYGAFPAKSIELERPRRSETPPLMAEPGTNGVAASVVTRWKFEPRDAADKGWLAFDKGETITNVRWIYKEQWCWSGTNRKGQLGLFPRSHVHFDKVKEEAAAIGARPATSGGTTRTKRGFLGWNRQNSSVAPSSASSVSGGSSVVEITM